MAIEDKAREINVPRRDLPKGVYKRPDNGKIYCKAWASNGNLVYHEQFGTVEEAEHARQIFIHGHKWVNMPDNAADTNFGFIYRITCKETGRMYIGSKQFYFWNGPVGGYKCTDPNDTDWWDPMAWRTSDWVDYCSSSKELQSQIAFRGEHMFRFEVIELCRNKLDLHLAEITWMVAENVLEATMDDGSYLYFNENIASKEYRAPFRKNEQKELVEQTKEAMRNYYLKPNVCCGHIVPFGHNHCGYCARKVG